MVLWGSTGLDHPYICTYIYIYIYIYILLFFSMRPAESESDAAYCSELLIICKSHLDCNPQRQHHLKHLGLDRNLLEVQKRPCKCHPPHRLTYVYIFIYHTYI